LRGLAQHGGAFADDRLEPRRTEPAWRIGRGERIDGLAYPTAGAVQEHALIFRADAEHLARGGGVMALHVSQHQHGALGCGHGGEHILHMRPKLFAAIDAFRVQRVPQAGGFEPVAVILELRQVHRSFVLRRAVEGGQGGQAGFLADAGAGAIEHDGEDPTGQARTTFKFGDAVEDRQPGILNHLLRLRPAADDASGGANECGVKAADQGAEGGIVAGA